MEKTTKLIFPTIKWWCNVEMNAQLISMQPFILKIIVVYSMLSKLKIADSNILADKAYGTADICNYISERGASYVIQPKTNAKEPWDYDIWLYKERHLIECFFNKLKAFRRVATRYDKLVSSFLAFVYIVSIWLLSKRYNSFLFSDTL